MKEALIHGHLVARVTPSGKIAAWYEGHGCWVNSPNIHSLVCTAEFAELATQGIDKNTRRVFVIVEKEHYMALLSKLAEFERRLN